MTPPLVDVAIGTYNHAKFVAQSLESVLAQQTTFGVRLFIADDCSTDGTQDILRSYEKRYPDRIETIIDHIHRGLSSPQRAYLKVLKQCKAKYVALLEGDDYWTDPLKLQKQVDFLEANPEYVLCAHRRSVLDENGIMHSDGFDDLFQGVEWLDVTIDNFLDPYILKTLTVVFRRDAFLGYFTKAPGGDLVIYAELLMHGRGRVLNDSMGVYRLHSASVFSSRSVNEQMRQCYESAVTMLNNHGNGIRSISSYFDSTCDVYLHQLVKGARDALATLAGLRFRVNAVGSGISSKQKNALNAHGAALRAVAMALSMELVASLPLFLKACASIFYGGWHRSEIRRNITLIIVMALLFPFWFGAGLFFSGKRLFVSMRKLFKLS